MNRIAGLGVTLCTVAGLAACDASNASGPPETSAFGVAAVAVAKPLAVSNAHRPIQGQIMGGDEYGDACGGGLGVTITSTGTGWVSHLGKAAMVSTGCVNLVDFSAIGPYPYSIKGADGDEIGGFLTGVEYTSYGFDLHTSITWGTGRFAGATGDLVWPTVSTFSGNWTSGLDGWISY